MYSVNALNTSSDMRLKKEFSNDFEKYIAMLDMINPLSFKRIIGKDRRRHTGYGAQLVEQALLSVGLEVNDFAGLSKEYDEETGDFTYGLAYEEFIPILHAKVNKESLYSRASIESMKARIEQQAFQIQQLFQIIAEQQKKIETLTAA